MACVGDSLTFGDGYHSYKLGTVRRCGWADAHCRGNWPMMLQKMLGERFDVRNFGKMGWPACRRLPLACLESSDATYTTPLSLTNSSTEQLNGCARAMRKWQVTQEALAFAPHILLLMLGTNDAMGSNWKQCGGDGFERAIALLLRVVLAEPISPFVLVLEPPPVLGEPVSFVYPCAAIHRCRSHPTKCAFTQECTSCMPDDTVRRDTCIWSPQLGQIRARLRTLVINMQQSESGKHAAVGKHLAQVTRAGGHHLGRRDTCLPKTVLMAPPLPINTNPDLFYGPVHLNARGTALIACHVHAQLLQCGSGECTSEKPSAAPHNASAQHEQVCSPLFTRYVNERASKAWLSGLENIALGPEVARVSEKNQKREKRVP